jgi:hypothetical protein
VGLNIPAVGLLSFMVGDFEAAWNALARVPEPAHRGNFMFALHSMVLMEVACRICVSDTSGGALRSLSAALAKRDPRYFTTLPGTGAKSPREFKLPHLVDAQRELLPMLFDLIRNGQGHQYQQITVRLRDGADFQIAITGAESELFLDHTFKVGRPKDHLSFFGGSGEELWLKFRTDVFFLDLRDSIFEATLQDREKYEIAHLSRPRHDGEYQFTARALEESIVLAGHRRNG